MIIFFINKRSFSHIIILATWTFNVQVAIISARGILFGVVGVGVAGISAHAHKNSQGGINREHVGSAVA